MRRVVESGVFLRPIVIDNCTVPESLAGLQVINCLDYGTESHDYESGHMQMFECIAPGSRLAGSLPHLYHHYCHLRDKLLGQEGIDFTLVAEEMTSLAGSIVCLREEIQIRKAWQMCQDIGFYERLQTHQNMAKQIAVMEELQVKMDLKNTNDHSKVGRPTVFHNLGAGMYNFGIKEDVIRMQGYADLLKTGYPKEECEIGIRKTLESLTTKIHELCFEFGLND